MLPQELEILLTAAFATLATSVLGVFLILRRLSLMSDAISHAILLGIVLVFFFTRDTSSPLQIVGATLTGLVLVFFAQMLWKTKLVKAETAIGLVFPLMFSLGILLISLYADRVHLDLDAVILGELLYVPFNRFDFGWFTVPKSLLTMATIGTVNLAFVVFFYKELKITTFDEPFSAVLGFAPALVNHLLMVLLSVTSVGTFEAVGSILVVALFVVPPATAVFVSKRLSVRIVFSCAFGTFCSLIGYGVAFWFDLAIAGSIATVMGVLFIACFLFHPRTGLFAENRQASGFLADQKIRSLLVHLAQHRQSREREGLCEKDKVHLHLNWEMEKTASVIAESLALGLVEEKGNGLLLLTEKGAERVRESFD